jgi:hypothetical protein
MHLTRKSATLATAVAIFLIAGCSEKTAPEPQNEVTGAAMPDTSQPGPNPPDAGATGLVAMGGDGAAQQRTTVDAAGNALPPVDLPAVQKK